MNSFVFSENSDQYRALVWRQFYHFQKKEFFQRKRAQTIFFIVIPILLLLAYFANGKTGNLVSASILLLIDSFWLLVFWARVRLLQKSVADFPNRHSYTMTLDEDNLTYTTAISRTELKWSYFREYDEFENNFILYPREIPREALSLPLSLAPENENMVALVRQKIKQREA